jgi:hypothetical protein
LFVQQTAQAKNGQKMQFEMYGGLGVAVGARVGAFVGVVVGDSVGAGVMSDTGAKGGVVCVQ